MPNFFSRNTFDRLIADIFSTEEFKSVTQGIIVGIFYTAGASLTFGLLSLPSIFPAIALVSAIYIVYSVYSAFKSTKPEEGADSDKKKEATASEKNTLVKFSGAVTEFINKSPGLMLVLPVALAGLMIYRSSPKVREIFDNTVMPKIKDLCTFLGRCYECLIPISNALQLKK